MLEAWFPGVEAGPALTRVLCGEVSPSGHLPVTFPRTVGQEPLYYNALPTGRPLPEPKLGPDGAPLPVTRFVSRYIDELNQPLFAFGHGLSYTTFSYSPVAASPEKLSAAAIARHASALTVASTVTNTGTRAATTVVQCYIRQRGTTVARPVRELAGFRRLALAPGQAERVEFRLGKRELAFWNLTMSHTVEPAQLEVWIAPDSVSGTPATVLLTP
jgi:beta-glucosidase